ncbi:hypothetical protein [Flavobacterium franklandianum]|uniref:hypothetical protein n=1 Tax=Flavobacterium franklandianum TaxID=2594430 RepID=UPI00163D4137|nr:hypothetical protein [Flavobacterium franklandianum]
MSITEEEIIQFLKEKTYEELITSETDIFISLIYSLVRKYFRKIIDYFNLQTRL